MAAGSAATVDFGREICGDLGAAEQREWLVTNGIGGYASGTVPGVLSRRYHGLLCAALKPPLGRTLLASKLEEFAEYEGRSYALCTNRWAGGAVDPEGFRQLERFRLEGTTPVWTFAFADALLEKRVWMEQGANTTYVCYTLVRAGGPVKLTLKALVNYRDYHSTTRGGDWRMDIAPVERGLRVTAFSDATPFHLLSASATAELAHDWYRNFELAIAQYRGLDDRDDHLHAGTFHATLAAGDSVTITISTESAPDLDGQAALERQRSHERGLLGGWRSACGSSAAQVPAWIEQYVLAADQFVVRRPAEGDTDGRSIIAGYHWFGDWGRDTMISPPGLALATGRPEIARRILRTFARYVDRGMLPNRFPDAGEAPEFLRLRQRRSLTSLYFSPTKPRILRLL
jgi:predicted glycogen debranching enzyme